MGGVPTFVWIVLAAVFVDELADIARDAADATDPEGRRERILEAIAERYTLPAEAAK